MEIFLISLILIMVIVLGMTLYTFATIEIKRED